MEQGTDIKYLYIILKTENICKLIVTYRCSFFIWNKNVQKSTRNDINSKNGCGWKW